MVSQRVSKVTSVLLLVGLLTAVGWIYAAGGPASLAELARLDVRFLPLILAATGTCIALRFVRWHYLLRRAGVRIPTRRSLSIYTASLAGIATPACLGESVRAFLVRNSFGVPVRTTLWVLAFERGLDILALALVGAITAASWGDSGLLLGGAAGVLGIGLIAIRAERHLRIVSEAAAKIRRGSVLIPALGISLAAWAPAALVISVAARSFYIDLDPAAGMHVFATATLFGAVSLMPAGVAATGSLAIVELQDLGLALGDAVLVTSLSRLGTVGIALAIASVFLVLELRALGRDSDRGTTDHFNLLAPEYLDQFSPHIWNLLLQRKLDLLTTALPDPPSAAGVGLDLGCGMGHQSAAMSDRGYSVIGLDVAHNLAREARRHIDRVVTGDAVELPFQDESLDFIYTIGVLHHLETRGAQESTCREVARVLKPGGLFIVHETNPKNPLFRFYMGYVFPIVRNVDRGTERWIQPAFWQQRGKLTLVDIEYFTFLPDFLPRFLTNHWLPLERRLESSALRPYSVHYMAVLQKARSGELTKGDPTGPTAVARELTSPAAYSSRPSSQL